jgi:hypothetical protein
MAVVIEGVQPVEEFALDGAHSVARAEPAIEEVFRQHHARIVGMLTRLTGNRQQAEDIAGEVFCKLARRPAVLRSRRNLTAWVYRIAANAGFDALRTRSRRLRKEEAAGVETLRLAARGAGRLEAQGRAHTAAAVERPGLPRDRRGVGSWVGFRGHAAGARRSGLRTQVPRAVWGWDMKQCRSKGELRAYLDGELPPEEIERVKAHVAECGACASAVESLSARAQRVSALLDDLSGAGRGAHRLRGPACLPVKRWPRRWVPAAALAACLALTFVLYPKRAKQPAIPAPVAVATTASVPAPAVAQVPRPALHRKRPQPRRPHVEYFLALDNDPFELGVVRRVALGPEEVLADVVFSPDGRPRAIRMVSDSKN